MITQQTRQMSFEDIKPKRPNLKQNILNNLDKPMTVQEIADKLYKLKLIKSNHRSEVAPRVTELLNSEQIKEFGTKIDYKSRKAVAIFEKV